jgi:hypothetical protein
MPRIQWKQCLIVSPYTQTPNVSIMAWRLKYRLTTLCMRPSTNKSYAYELRLQFGVYTDKELFRPSDRLNLVS